MTKSTIFRAALIASASFAAIIGSSAFAQDVPIIQPGIPGQASKAIDAVAASKTAETRYSPLDVAFVQGMIHHHWQAVEMARLVEARTNTPAMRDAAGRIEASQESEIAFMRQWLIERGEHAPNPADRHAGHAGHAMPESAHSTMKGMASAADMAKLATLEGAAFERLFLNLMIAHHRGALTMVSDLLGEFGTAFDPRLYDFANDVKNDQTAEIDRMTAMLTGLTTDPRTTLTGGYLDAETAALYMKLLASLPRPTGFFDPANPAGLKPEIEPEGEAAEDRKPQFGKRQAWTMMANTDMAFSGDTLVLGSFRGFNIYKLDQAGMPSLYSSVVCPGGQGDVSIVDDLLITSVESTNGRKDCGTGVITDDVSPDRHRGLRIFDISNLRVPQQVGLVQTCRGSHTHSIVATDEKSILVYNSGTSGVRKEGELAGCVGNEPGNDRTSLFSIDVIEIPRADPSQARIIDSPRVFANYETGQIAGLWRGGDHGEGTQTTNDTNQCHDITIFPTGNIAAGACSGNGIVLDISDPRKPVRIDDVTDKGFAYWHSATFNNDGTKVLFTDEWGGGYAPRCRASDPLNWGANAIYDIVEGKLQFRSHFKMPAPQGDKENCVAHNGSLVPVPGRDIFVQAWYQGGISVIDFTDSAKPVEIAYFDRGPLDNDQFAMAGFWSVYYYRGKIYGAEIARGLDVLELEPSEFISANELAAAALAEQGATFNPQQQFQVTWPDKPVVARAYLDQLARTGFKPWAGLKAALDLADKGDASAAGTLESEAAKLDKTGIQARLAATLKGIAAALRKGG